MITDSTDCTRRLRLKRATFHCVIKKTTPPRRRRILSPLLRTSTHEAVAALFVKTVLLAVVQETAQDCVPGQNCRSRAEILSGTMFEHTRANQRAPNADRDNTAAHTHHHPHQHTSRTGHREQANTRDPARPSAPEGEARGGKPSAYGPKRKGTAPSSSSSSSSKRALGRLPVGRTYGSFVLF